MPHTKGLDRHWVVLKLKASDRVRLEKFFAAAAKNGKTKFTAMQELLPIVHTLKPEEFRPMRLGIPNELLEKLQLMRATYKQPWLHFFLRAADQYGDVKPEVGPGQSGQ